MKLSEVIFGLVKILIYGNQIQAKTKRSQMY